MTTAGGRIFLLMFVVARVVTFLIMAHRIPDLYLHLGGPTFTI